MMSRWDMEQMSDEARYSMVMVLLGEGKDEGEVAKSVGVGAEEWGQFRKRCFEWAADEVREKSTGEVFVEYMLNQKRCISDLEGMAERFGSARHYSALVGSVKARSDIYDKVIKMGQDLGLLERRPERKEIVAGVLVAKMDDQQLRDVILGELRNLDELMGVVRGGLMELPEPVLHREAGARGHRSKANRVIGGRRVMKRKLGER